MLRGCVVRCVGHMSRVRLVQGVGQWPYFGKLVNWYCFCKYEAGSICVWDVERKTASLLDTQQAAGRSQALELSVI